MSDNPSTEGSSRAEKAQAVTFWLVSNWLHELSSPIEGNDRSEILGQHLDALRTLEAVRQFERPEYLLNPDAKEIELLQTLQKGMEQLAINVPEAWEIIDLLSDLIGAVLRHEFIVKTATKDLAVLVLYEPEPPHWGYVAGEIVEPDDSRLASYESWPLTSSERQVLRTLENPQPYSTVGEAHSAAVEHLELRYGPTSADPTLG